jgi:hypothetical protein
VLLLSAGYLCAQTAARVDFQRDIQPILQRCVGCHGTTVQSSGLRLDRRDDALRGGYSGAVILPGNSAGSRLVRLVSGQVEGLVMPPVGARLKEPEIATLRAWIDSGAAWPADGSPEPPASTAVRQSTHWAFQPIVHPAVPSIRSPWIRNEIDSFILARLDAQGVKPSPEAGKPVLARRLYLDLIGLPPQPEELDEFLTDKSADAYERLVDRLLASPHYGEKWGRYWLDLARYAESNGFSSDRERPWAWRYRDWVVQAFNRDLPFDRFTVEQLAGDLLSGAGIEERVATGFLRNNLTDVEAGVDLTETRFKQVVDRTNAVGTVWMGLTIGCAQCHDHKFDPISQKEYYQMFAFFDRADDLDIDAPLAGELGPYLQSVGEYERRRQALLAEYKVGEWQRWWEQHVLEAGQHPGKHADWDFVWTQLGSTDFDHRIIRLRPEQRTRRQQRFLTERFIAMFSFDASKAEYEANKYKELSAKLKKLDTGFPHLTQAQTIAEQSDPEQTFLRRRGNYQAKGIPVEPNTPAVLPPMPAAKHPNRLTLARWLVSPENPLTARVAADRFWQELFGRGIVESSENFGVRGEKPSHPELLDWLAAYLRDNGWSMKQTIRKIVTSATYRQSSAPRPDLAERDPENRLFARQPRVRLTGELIRDEALAAGGLLNLDMGGRSVYPPLPRGASDTALTEDVRTAWPESKGRDRYRRSIYIHSQRRLIHPQLANFDQPDTTQSCPRRERSNTPLQALNSLNDPVLVECAVGLANRVLERKASSFRDRLNYAFRIALGRLPGESEVARLKDYFERRAAGLREDPKVAEKLFPSAATGADPIESAAWVGVARVLLNLDEFITRE